MLFDQSDNIEEHDVITEDFTKTSSSDLTANCQKTNESNGESSKECDVQTSKNNHVSYN